MIDDNERSFDDIVNKIGFLASELETTRIYRVLGYVKEDKLIEKYTELQMFEEDLLDEYEAKDLYKIIKEIEFYYGNRDIKGLNFIKKSVRNLKEHLFEYVVLGENLSEEEQEKREDKVNGFLEKIDDLSTKRLVPKNKLSLDEKNGQMQEVRDEVDGLVNEIVTNSSSGDLREFLDALSDKYRGKNMSLVVRSFMDSIKKIDVVDLTIDECFGEHRDIKKDELYEDEIARIVNDSLVLSSRYDYFETCCRTGVNFKKPFEQAKSNLNDFVDVLTKKYEVDDLYRIVQAIDGYLESEESMKKDRVSGRLKDFIYENVKDNLVKEDAELVNDENVDIFFNRVLDLANIYGGIGKLSGDEARRLNTFFMKRKNGFISELFEECNNAEIDKVVSASYTECKENKFKDIEGVRYIVSCIDAEKRERALKEYFSSDMKMNNKKS